MEDRNKIINGILGTCLESIDFIHIYNYENGDQTIHITMKDEEETRIIAKTNMNEEIDITPVMLTKKMNLPEKEEGSKEEKPKTYLEDVLEKYPDLELGIGGNPLYVCPWHLGYDEDGCNTYDNCLECWNRPMKEEETNESTDIC